MTRVPSRICSVGTSDATCQDVWLGTDGHVRLSAPTRTWEDYVELGASAEGHYRQAWDTQIPSALKIADARHSALVGVHLGYTHAADPTRIKVAFSAQNVQHR